MLCPLLLAFLALFSTIENRGLASAIFKPPLRLAERDSPRSNVRKNVRFSSQTPVGTECPAGTGVRARRGPPRLTFSSGCDLVRMRQRIAETGSPRRRDRQSCPFDGTL